MTRKTIIVDYGSGNIASILNMHRYLGIEATTSALPHEILKADRIILPGVGAFDSAMSKLQSSGLDDTIREFVKIRQKPVLGICLGMQLLMEKSQEGIESGLGLIPGQVIQFEASKTLRVPHMGWRKVTINAHNQLTSDLSSNDKFYFVHSYYVKPKYERDVALSINYGSEVTVAIANQNIYGVQFHPEKSHKHGMKIFENFGSING